MPAFIGKNPRAWWENIAGDSGGKKLREGVAGRVAGRAGGKHGGVKAKRWENIQLSNTPGSPNLN
jgi:hypothetical protein